LFSAGGRCNHSTFFIHKLEIGAGKLRDAFDINVELVVALEKGRAQTLQERVLEDMTTPKPFFPNRGRLRAYGVCFVVDFEQLDAVSLVVVG
jgi:hypothetical protein